MRNASVSVCCALLLGISFVLVYARGAFAGFDFGTDPNALVNEVIQNEVAAQEHDRTYWKFREATNTGGKKEIRDVIQTKYGEIYRVVAVNDLPLSPGAMRAEDFRLEKMVARLEDLENEKRKREDAGEKERELLKSFPKAFRFRYDGREGDLVRLRFTPNPGFYPAKRMEQAFRHMEGVLTLDVVEKRLAGIEGIITGEVRFGGGILGRLDKGGTFSVKLEDMGSGHWDVVQLDVHLIGKALLFKTIDFQQQERCSGYSQVAENVSVQQAVQLLQSGTGQQVATK
jgi:hypothetical protein